MVKLILTTMVGASTMELTESVIGGGVSIIRNSLSYLVHCIISFLLKNIYNFSFVKCTVHPTSHSWSIDSSEPETNSLKIYALVASSDKS